MSRSLFYFLSLSSLAAAQDPCTPCFDGLDYFLITPRPGENGYKCKDGVDQAMNLTMGSPECLSVQLATYQGGCCDSPPVGYCTLCPNGSQDFNADKIIPRNEDNPRDVTCADVEQRNQYVRDVQIYGQCAETPRELSRDWCECDGDTQIACNLVCDDGNQPSDLTKSEPIFAETCARFQYEFATLSANECPNAATLLNFDAKAFCCNEKAPDNCSICPDGQTLLSSDKVVRTEFFGDATCGEIATHASFLPEGQCDDFIDKLLDNPFGASVECCLDGAGNVSGGFVAATRIDILTFSLLGLFPLVSL